MANDPVTFEKRYPATPDRIWKALSDRETMKLWYFDLAEFRAETGFAFQFYGGPADGTQYLHLCQITEADPPNKLAYSWRYDGYAGISYVIFELFPEGENTRLRLTHAGLESFPANNPDFARQNFVEGWKAILGTSLSNFLAG